MLNDPRVLLIISGLLLTLLASTSKTEASRDASRIVLVPIGTISPDLTSWLQQKLPGILQLEVTTAGAFEIPKSAYRSGRSQYLGDEILADLQTRVHPSSREQRFVGLIDEDCYAPGLNFIFGQALAGGQVAFVALPRLRQSFYGEREEEGLFRERVLKEVVHELGHTWNLPHCPNQKCVMHFSNSLGDTDFKSGVFCDACKRLRRVKN